MSEDGAPMAWAAPTVTAADTENDPLTWSLGTQAAHGTAIISGTGAAPTEFVYAPNADYVGADTLTVTVSDGHGGAATITIDVVVEAANDAPRFNVSGPVTVTMSEDGVPVAWTAPALAATDPDGDAITWSVATPPAHGTASVSGTGATPTVFDYAPAANFNGYDVLEIQIADPGMAIAKMLVTVEAQPVSDTGDADGDGLTDDEEYTLGTNPGNPDSDGDGASDGDEVHGGTNPLDDESGPLSVSIIGDTTVQATSGAAHTFGARARGCEKENGGDGGIRSGRTSRTSSVGDERYPQVGNLVWNSKRSSDLRPGSTSKSALRVQAFDASGAHLRESPSSDPTFAGGRIRTADLICF